MLFRSDELFPVVYSVLADAVLAMLLNVVPTGEFCFIEIFKITFLISPGLKLLNPVHTKAGRR